MSLEAFDDAELLQLMAGRKDDEPSAKAAFGEFYSRHIRWFYSQCEKHKALIPAGDVESFALDIMEEVYRSKAQSFLQTAFETEDDCRRAVRAWLATIARNRSIDRYRLTEDVAELSGVEWANTTVPCENNSSKHTQIRQEIALAASMIEDLDDRNRSIVTTYLHFWEPGKNIPSKVLQELADEYDLTKDAVRKIYFRFRDRVREAVLNLMAGK